MIERYTDEQSQLLRRHIQKHFGAFSGTFEEKESPDIHLDIAVITPTPERNYYTLVTMGMGAHRMDVPADLAEYKLERAELMISLPPYWDLESSLPQWYWPIGYMKWLARLPLSEQSWMAWGHSTGNPDDPKTIAAGVPFCGVMLIARGDESSVCKLPDGSEINFYDLLPLYHDELAFKLSHSARELMTLFEEDCEPICLSPLDPRRKNVCAAAPDKHFAVDPEDWTQLLENWNWPAGCYATDKIMVDGEAVGYCYRERPAECDTVWDSGWRFFQGSESDAYANDPSHVGTYSLNTLCNFDADVLALLNAPYGSAFARDKKGVFRPVPSPTPGGPADPLLTAEEIDALENFDEGPAGGIYAGSMITFLDDLIDRSVAEGRFTRKQARADLDIALWYSYACINYDTYIEYYRAAQWMPDSRKNAKGCGMWFYRYGCAMLYCGRLEEAAEAVEQGLIEEPDYPWGWLLAGQLRCHFGDKVGAKAAVERGLALVPGDYEFSTLRREIDEGCTLEEMAFHWIDPAADRALHAGLSDHAETAAKKKGVAAILCDEAKLAQIKALQSGKWEEDCPYCTCHTVAKGQAVDVAFRGNRAMLSKLDPTWLSAIRAQLADDAYWLRTGSDGVKLHLDTVIFDWFDCVRLLYQEEGSGAYWTVSACDGDGSATRGLCAPEEIDRALENLRSETENPS